MDSKYNNTLCNLCLCDGRTLTQLHGYWKNHCFIQILNEVQLAPNEHGVLLCWECDAILSKFVKFKSQVINSYRTLLYYFRQNLETTDLRREPRLKEHKVLLEDINPCTPSNLLTSEEVKLEIDDSETKVNDIQNDNLSYCTGSDKNPSDSDDDQKLSELCQTLSKKTKNRNNATEKNDIVNGHRKRKKRKKKIAELYSLVELNREELLEERRSAALEENYVNSEYKCEKCISVFPNLFDLNEHLSNKHALNHPLVCPICECSFASEVSYKYHANKHVRRYRCAICARTFATKHLAEKHHGAEHARARIVCDVCLQEFGTEEEYVSHRMTHEQDLNNGQPKDVETDMETKEEDSSLFPCEQCDKTFRWKTSLRKHAETHRIQAGEKRIPYCETCRMSFTTTSNLQKHVKTSSNHQIQLKLRKLKEGQAQEVSHIEQIKRDVADSVNKYPCPHCERRFQWRGNLARHVKSHRARAAGELHCAPCERSFSSIATYRQHMALSRRHVAETDYKHVCSECGKKFANKTRLKDHVDWEHLKNYVHTCQVCHKVFKSHTSLYLHKKVVHRREGDDHLCDHCGKPFPNRGKLRSHIVAMHTTEQPYRCGLCAAAFSWHSCLSRHVKVVHHKVKLKRRRAKKDDE